MSVKLLTEHNLEFLSLKGGCKDSIESTGVKMPHFWKSHVTAHIAIVFFYLKAKLQVPVLIYSCQFLAHPLQNF